MLFDSITDVATHREIIRSRRYGCIEVVDECLSRISFRPWPKLISIVEASWIGGWQHKRSSSRVQHNKCLVYFNQPIGHSSFLTLSYFVTTPATSFATVRGALVVLDEIAKLKRSNGILCEVTNDRITGRMLERFGWERHLETSRHRHYIKRFYGSYPDHDRESILIGNPINKKILVPAPEVDALRQLDTSEQTVKKKRIAIGATSDQALPFDR